MKPFNLTAKKKKENNPYAICTESVGRDDPEKLERCILDVKKKNKEKGAFNLKNIKKKGQIEPPRKFYFHINLDERGEFYADIRDENDQTVFEIKGFEIFEDGFMKDKTDMRGLGNYLVQLGIIDENDDLIYVG